MSYRVLLSLLMLSGVVGSILHTPGRDQWLLFATSQGVTLLTVHYLLDTVLVLSSLCCCPPPSSSSSGIPLLYRLSWALHQMTFTAALGISIVYWTLLHPFVVRANGLTTALDVFLNAFVHALNSVSCLVDIVISARPVGLTK